MRMGPGVRQSVTEDQAGVTDISQISHGLGLEAGQGAELRQSISHRG